MTIILGDGFMMLRGRDAAAVAIPTWEEVKRQCDEKVAPSECRHDRLWRDGGRWVCNTCFEEFLLLNYDEALAKRLDPSQRTKLTISIHGSEPV